jgi:peptidyl-prolyl cis-trans isomerase D
MRASHILVAYSGALRASPAIQRTKPEAQKLATELLGRLKKGEDFAKLAGQHSDDPSGRSRGGDLGNFEREAMVKPFADAAFALKPGEVSGLVETSFGFHIIKRAN